MEITLQQANTIKELITQAALLAEHQCDDYHGIWCVIEDANDIYEQHKNKARIMCGKCENLENNVEYLKKESECLQIGLEKTEEKTDLDYVGACAALGECLMHSMRCAGNIEDPNA